MRFCTAEEKEAPIAAKLKKMFPGQTIINVTGIRREESSNRAKSPIVKLNKRMTNRQTSGVNWMPILDYTLDDVLTVHREKGFPMNPVYTEHGLSRFSCSFCIMSKASDLEASAAIVSNQDVYRELVDLEIESTFSFHSTSWLGDVAPELLSDERRQAFASAKMLAKQRETAEARIPKELLYVKGWPTFVPSPEQASLIADVRREVATVLGLEWNYRDAIAVAARYAVLLVKKNAKGMPK
jgi:3'-phosphoadenosine 5'-phosphosulfate sulfotransferase (PAPS reductase)/FAD synthetase